MCDVDHSNQNVIKFLIAVHSEYIVTVSLTPCGSCQIIELARLPEKWYLGRKKLWSPGRHSGFNASDWGEGHGVLPISWQKKLSKDTVPPSCLWHTLNALWHCPVRNKYSLRAVCVPYSSCSWQKTKVTVLPFCLEMFGMQYFQNIFSFLNG